MSTNEQTRKWTATITIAGETFAADGGRYDTLRETRDAALNEAVELIRAECGSDASVVMYKQLKKDPEPKYDRPGGYVYRDNGRILIDRWSH